MRIFRLRYLFLAGVLVTTLHMLSVRTYPRCWYDEVSIVECARISVFDIGCEYSTEMVMEDGVPKSPGPLFHYISGVVQECLWRLTDDWIPARIFYLFSLLFGSCALWSYLREKDVGRPVAAVVSLSFLVDPILTADAHWYRPDVYAVALLFVTLTGVARLRRMDGRMAVWVALACGGLCAVGVAFWICFGLFAPLVVGELLLSTKGLRVGRRLALLSVLAIGALMMTAVLLIPMAGHLLELATRYLGQSEIGTVGQVGGTFADRIVNFGRIMIRTPLLLVAAAFALFRAGHFAHHAVTLTLLTALLLSTRVHSYRVVYLMPMLFVLAAAALENGLRRERRLTHVFSMLMLFYGLAFAVVLNFAGFVPGDPCAEQTEALANVVTGERPRVYLYDAERNLYNSGRKLGWRMFRIATLTHESPDLIFATDRSLALLRTLDYVLYSTGREPDAREVEILKANGFRKIAEIRPRRYDFGRVKAALRSLFYAKDYEPVFVFKRR